jgi:hypothetical protein
MMRRLATATHPLLVVEPSAGPVDRHSVVRLTDVGGQVLAAAADHVAVNCIDRWIGGMHLHGDHAEWRFDEGTETLTRH